MVVGANLHGRQSKFSFRNATSSTCDLKTGVLQGEVTSLVLFNFYITLLPAPPGVYTIKKIIVKKDLEFRLKSSAAHSESIGKAGVKRKCNMFFASALQVKNKKAMDLTEKLNESAHKFQKPLVHEEESIVKKKGL